VEQTGNVEILGIEFVKSSQGKAVASMNRRMRDPLKGKTVLIIGGEWKGYRGLVTQADDKQVIIEISSKGAMKIPIDRSLIDENVTGGNF
jgi:transcription elongation factor